MNHVSEDMGNDTDGQLFAALRNWADVVLVGAQTVRAEDYSGVKPNGDGSRPAPIAVPSRSLDFDITSDFFTDFTTPPIILIPIAAGTIKSSQSASRPSNPQARKSAMLAKEPCRTTFPS